jgi:hypothetical protein
MAQQAPVAAPEEGSEMAPFFKKFTKGKYIADLFTGVGRRAHNTGNATTNLSIARIAVTQRLHSGRSAFNKECVTRVLTAGKPDPRMRGYSWIAIGGVAKPSVDSAKSFRLVRSEPSCKIPIKSAASALFIASPPS